MFELISLFLQTMGLTIILISQAIFYLRVRREWGSLGKAFLSLTTPQSGIGKEKLLKMSHGETKEALKIFRLARFLYDDFRVSVFGLLCALIGTLLLFVWGLFQYTRAQAFLTTISPLSFINQTTLSPTFKSNSSRISLGTVVWSFLVIFVTAIVRIIPDITTARALNKVYKRRRLRLLDYPLISNRPISGQ